MDPMWKSVKDYHKIVTAFIVWRIFRRTSNLRFAFCEFAFPWCYLSVEITACNIIKGIVLAGALCGRIPSTKKLYANSLRLCKVCDKHELSMAPEKQVDQRSAENRQKKTKPNPVCGIVVKLLRNWHCLFRKDITRIMWNAERD